MDIISSSKSNARLKIPKQLVKLSTYRDVGNGCAPCTGCVCNPRFFQIKKLNLFFPKTKQPRTNYNANILAVRNVDIFSYIIDQFAFICATP
jgi:hypothetical protein